MSPLSAINAEIYHRWKAGENYVDLANEFRRNEWGIRRYLFQRACAEAYAERQNEEDCERGWCSWHASPWVLHKINAPRDSEIVARRDAGISWRKLGEEFKLSPERVRQIYRQQLRMRRREEIAL
jgi:Mor family transcriptional regulator